MKKNKFLWLWILLGSFFLVGIIGGIVYFAISGTPQSTVNIPSGQYVQAPTFYYYECNAGSQPVESTHVNLDSGSTNGWLKCPSNTDTCDLWISQTEQTAWYSLNRRIVYQICHNNGANCDSQVIKTSNYFSLSNANVPSIHLPNLLTTDKVWVDYQYQNLLFQWILKPNSAEYYQTYKPFILWKVDMFGGGKNEYTTPTQGCNFPSNDVANLIDSVTNLNKQLNSQSSTSDTSLPFYKTRNFIGTYVPISTSNVNFVNYNGQSGYCLQRQVFAITSVTTNGGTYQIIDSNFNTRLANSVDCCPGETEPTRKCNSNFQWENIEVAQCSAFSPCAGADWADSSSKTQIRYNCINSKCVAETRTVECVYDSDCGNNKVCATLTHKCETVGTGEIVQNNTNGTSQNCKWYQDSYVTSQKVCNFLFFGCEDKPKSGCTMASWLIWTIIITIILVVIGIIILFGAIIKNLKSSNIKKDKK